MNGNTLSDQEREMLLARAANLSVAHAVLQLVHGAGMRGEDAAEVLMTAALAVLGRVHAGPDRLRALNALLGPTIREWGGLVESVR